MAKIAVERHDDVAVIRLCDGVTNPISQEMVDELREAVRALKDEGAGLVLAGGDKFFCIGLSLPTLLALDRPGFDAFYASFEELLAELYAYPMPTACAVTGHAPGGGACLALSCDYRFMAPGRTSIGLVEVKLGVPVPYLTQLALQQVVEDRAARDLLFHGELVNAGEALGMGLVDRVSEEGEAAELALAHVMPLMEKPASAFESIKASRTDAVMAMYEKNRAKRHKEFVDCWFSEGTQALLDEQLEKF